MLTGGQRPSAWPTTGSVTRRWWENSSDNSSTAPTASTGNRPATSSHDSVRTRWVTKLVADSPSWRMCIRVFVYMGVCVCVSVFLYVHVCLPVSVYMRVHACRCDFVYVRGMGVLVKWQIKVFIVIKVFLPDGSTLSNQHS